MDYHGSRQLAPSNWTRFDGQNTYEPLVLSHETTSKTYVYTALHDLDSGEPLIPLFTPRPKPSSHEATHGNPTDGGMSSSYHSSIEPFVYTGLEDPLEDGRLIILYPVAQNERITCDIINMKMSRMVDFPYEALSYVWGADSPMKSIQLDGRIKNVRENLWMALQQLRHSDKKRILWVDAICIDQESEVERNHQVRQMGKIYGHAERVLVWLGPHSGLSELAFSFIRQLEGEARKKKVDESDREKVIAAFYEKWVVAGGLGIFWAAFRNLCKRKYWERLWIIQEIGLARDIEIYCGSEHISGDVFHGVIQRAKFACRQIARDISTQKSEKSWERRDYSLLARISDREVQLLEEGLSQIMGSLPTALFRMREARHDKAALRELCIGARHSVCFDPRDKVFGLSGLAFDAPERVDYSITLFHLFQQTLLSDSDTKMSLRADLLLARSLQHSFARALSDKTLEQVYQMKNIFDLPIIDSSVLLSTSGYLVGSIEALCPAWIDGVTGRPAPDSPRWLQDVTRDGSIHLQQRLQLHNEEVRTEIQSEIDLVQPINSPASYGEYCSNNQDESSPCSPHTQKVALGESSKTSRPPGKRMIVKSEGYSVSNHQVFRMDLLCGIGGRMPGGTFNSYHLGHHHGLVPYNVSLNDVICAIDIPSTGEKVTWGVVHIVLRWQTDRYSIVGRAFMPHEYIELRTNSRVRLWMSALVLQLITA